MADLLSKDHCILEKGMMEFRPFGRDIDGRKISDISGLTVSGNVEFLQETVRLQKGHEAGRQAAEELVCLLNDRIPDPAYFVDVKFLMNEWNSYSYEFVMFLAEFCNELSGDSLFQQNLGREKFIPPTIQILGRPFSMRQICKMFPHFGEKYAKGSIHFETVEVSKSSAVLRMRFTEQTLHQFGLYRNRCAWQICQATKAAISSIPAKIHQSPTAMVTDRRCIAEGDDYCEWELFWASQKPSHWGARIRALALMGFTFGYLSFRYPEMPLVEALLLSMFPGAALWFLGSYRLLKREIKNWESVVHEQIQSVDARHEELRESYLEQEHTMVELRRKIGELTTLHDMGLRISSTLDREGLIKSALRAIVDSLHYDRAMISFYDSQRGVTHSAHLVGASPEIAAFAQALEVPISDPNSPEGTVILKGEPLLISDVGGIYTQLHPLNQQLSQALGSQALIAVPLRVKSRIIGLLLADRIHVGRLTQDDVNLLTTIGNHIAIALDNADAYAEIEQLNVGLETKVYERTAELEQVNQELATANERLQELDRLKSQFLSHCSHELRTPLTSIKGFTDNLLQGIGGTLSDKQQASLIRVSANADRLSRMITDLLDLSRIEAGKNELKLSKVNLPNLAREVIENLHPLAHQRDHELEVSCAQDELIILADADRLHQVLTNLVHNAIKFTPNKGKIQVQVDQKEGALVRIAVIDNGCGIPAESLSKLFDPFFQAPHRHEISKMGLGLGLAIVKHLVELHHGTVTVTSEPGHGTTFQVILPVEHDEPNHQHREELATKEIKKSLKISLQKNTEFCP